MIKFSNSIAYTTVATALSLTAFSVAPAHAVGFSGSYDPSNFTLTNTNGNGSVNTTGAPNSIALTGSNGGGAPIVTLSNFSVAADATSVPEPFTIIGTCIGGTAAFRMRKKQTSGKKA